MLYFKHDDLQIAYVDQGSGAPLILIHGFPFDHLMWQAQIEALSVFCRVIAPDLRGFGQSTAAPADAAEGVTMERYATDVLATLDHLELDEPVILCGFSMGGYILWQFVLRYPERVRAIVLCDTRADADSAEVCTARLRMADEVSECGAGAVAEAMLPKLLAPATLAHRPELVASVAQLIRRADPAAIAAAQRGMARRRDVRRELCKIDRPAFVLVGGHDTISTPMEMREVVSALPDARLVEIPEAGHMTTMENPVAVNAALQTFVKSL